MGQGLQQALVSEGGRFSFHQAVRLLDLLAISLERGGPVGATSHPESEGVEIKGHPSLAFAGAAIRKATDKGALSANGASLEVTFGGLTGAAGVLPTHYTELVIARESGRDRTLRDFLDVLQRRSLSLYHRAWVHARFPVAFESEARQHLRHDAFTRSLLSLVGLGSESLLRRQAVDDLAFIHAAGAFARRTRTAESLAGLLTATFGVPFKVEQFVGHWIELEDGDASTLLARGETPDARHALGGGFSLGTRVWDVASRLRLVAGPLSLEELRFFAAESPGRLRVTSMARGYLGDEFDFDLECVLREGESPGVTLGGGTRLGADTWLEHAPGPDQKRGARFALERF